MPVDASKRAARTPAVMLRMVLLRIRHGYVLRFQEIDRLIVKLRLVVRFQVIEVGGNHVFTLRDDVRHHPILIVGLRFPFVNGNRAFRAMADARAEAVAEQVAYEPRLAVHDLDRAFGAIRNARAAARAFVRVDGNDGSLHYSLPHGNVARPHRPFNIACGGKPGLDPGQENKR